MPQRIRIKIQLDEVDTENIVLLENNKEKINQLMNLYTSEPMLNLFNYQQEYVIDIALNASGQKFQLLNASEFNDVGFTYLTKYFLYQKIVELYNIQNPTHTIQPLYETFSLIGCYRNYNSFSSSVSFAGEPVNTQMLNLRKNEYSRGVNTSEQSEPSIFSLVRLRLADKCQKLIITNKSQLECEKAANNEEFIQKINDIVSAFEIARFMRPLFFVLCHD